MQQNLQRLKPYITRPPVGAPPEILPWEHADAWGVEGTARSTLALILEGGRQLDALAEYMMVFCNEGYGTAQCPDALLVNGTALALCGYLSHGTHPEAELWRVAGCARLATELHARKAALSDRLAADCLLTVCEVADEMGLPILSDLITLRERMWGRLLDHSRAERLHVSEQEYPAHMTAPVHPTAWAPSCGTAPGRRGSTPPTLWTLTTCRTPSRPAAI